MDWIFDNDRPIYLQLIEKLKIAIISSYYKAGERLPSVRELALETKANPNTVQRAFTELESMGLIYTQRTNGKFVTENQELLRTLKEQLATENFQKYVDSMKKLGYEEEDIWQHMEKEKMEIRKRGKKE